MTPLNVYKRNSITLLGIGIICFFSLKLVGFSKENTANPQEKLRLRAEEFFSLLQKVNYEQASKLCLKKSRKEFLVQKKWKIEKFKLGEIRLSEDGKSATVQVLVAAAIPMSPKELNIPRLTQWRIESGNWFFDPTEVPSTVDPELAEAQNKIALRMKKDPKAPPPAILWEKVIDDLGIVPKKKGILIHLPFTNLSDQEISIKKTFLQAEYCRVLNEDLVVKPHEKGRIDVEINTEKLNWYFALTLQFQFKPINELVSATIRGTAR